MERRVLFAVFLCFLVLYLWQALVVKPVPVAPAAGDAPETAATATAGPPATEPATPERAREGAPAMLTV